MNWLGAINLNRALCLAVFRLTDGRESDGDWVQVWNEEAKSAELAWSTLSPYLYLGATTLDAAAIVVAIAVHALWGGAAVVSFVIWLLISTPVACAAVGSLACSRNERRAERRRRAHRLPLLGDEPVWDVNIVANRAVLLRPTVIGYAVALAVSAGLTVVWG